MISNSSGSITLYYSLPVFVNARARQLGLRKHNYLGILLSNFLNQKEEDRFLMAVFDDRSSKVKRLRMQLSLPCALRKAGQRMAAGYGVSFSRLMECLITRDALHGLEPFTIYPVDGMQKPACEFPPSDGLSNAKIPGETRTERDIFLDKALWFLSATKSKTASPFENEKLGEIIRSISDLHAENAPEECQAEAS